MLWRKDISASSATATAVHQGPALPYILQQLQGPPANHFPTCHFTPTGLLPSSIYASVTQTPLLASALFRFMPSSSSAPPPLPSQSTSVNCTSDPSAQLFCCPLAPQPFSCSTTAASISHSILILPYSPLNFSSSSFKPSQFTLSTVSQCHRLHPSHGHLQLSLSHVSG